jgi:hypothetical protein
VARLARLSLLCLLAMAAVVAGGCGDTEELRSISATEGPYVHVGDLTYQIQMSRILEPSEREDQGYLKGVAAGDAPTANEVWFAVFMRVENQTDRPLRPAGEFEIEDTQGNRYTPVSIDRNVNVFAYDTNVLGPKAIAPLPDSPAFNGPIQGDLILFKLKVATLYNRPLEFHIITTEGGGDRGTIDLDV